MKLFDRFNGISLLFGQKTHHPSPCHFRPGCHLSKTTFFDPAEAAGNDLEALLGVSSDCLGIFIGGKIQNERIFPLELLGQTGTPELVEISGYTNL